ncbi:hypothetical protein P8452_42823 [Trifolium repens]|nr:hypothetical protein P8452_42823 [Trifolium repens]
MWSSQPRLFVGRGMQEGTISLFKYSTFWVRLILSKLAFSYYLEVALKIKFELREFLQADTIKIIKKYLNSRKVYWFKFHLHLISLSGV